MSRIYDISPLISRQMAVWPGDTPFTQEFLCRFESGDNLDLSTIRSTVHLGAHTDAPRHYHPEGSGMESRDLQYYLGPAQVIHVSVSRGQRIFPKDVSVPIQAPRVLFGTNSYPDPNHFNEDFCALSPELITFLANQGVKLVGIDTPSVDPFHSKALESHNAIYQHDMAVLEGIVLTGVPEGVYTLSALPLRILGADASPVRAVLF